MEVYLPLILAFILFPLHTWCQTVQDDWTAPAAPDGSTPLRSDTRFTLLWKTSLQNNFEQYCPSCNPKKLDLWVTNFNGTKYMAKIGRGVDVTTTTSYDWTVQIASSEFSSQDFWVFRFTFFDSTDPYTEQISSPGFKINGLVKASSTLAIQSSSTTSAVPTTSSIATTSTSTATSTNSVAFSSSSAPQSTPQASTPSPSSKSNVWISGVVLGPVVGIALGAALVWFCLRKRKNKEAQQNQGCDQSGCYQQYPSDHNLKERYSYIVTSELETGNHGQGRAEVPGSATPAPPAELWQGNYKP